MARWLAAKQTCIFYICAVLYGHELLHKVAPFLIHVFVCFFKLVCLHSTNYENMLNTLELKKNRWTKETQGS